MKTVIVLGLGALILLAGFRSSNGQRRKTLALGEMVDFARFIRSEVQYRVTDAENLARKFKNEKFAYVRLEGDVTFTVDIQDDKARGLFGAFINRLGTTDKQGQLDLCDEYIAKFGEQLDFHKQNEKSRIRINTALSVFGALCMVILFL